MMSFDGGDEELRGRRLQERALLADALVLAHRDHRPLGRQQRVVEHADERVAPGELGPGMGRAAAELLLVEPDHRARHGGEHGAAV